MNPEGTDPPPPSLLDAADPSRLVLALIVETAIGALLSLYVLWKQLFDRKAMWVATNEEKISSYASKPNYVCTVKNAQAQSSR